MKKMGGGVKNVLFVCSQNRLRSPTAEQIFSSRSDLEVNSAGTNRGADNPLTDELIVWADVIFAMERVHRSKIQQMFRGLLKDKRIICLNIPDNYEFMDPDLVALLVTKLAKYL